jgi:hypothetical protein
MERNISDHLQWCDKCQITKRGKASPELLSPLPQCTEPIQRVHADLFGILKTSQGDKKFILFITDAFTKYVELVVLPNKEALMIVAALINCWICRYGFPLEFITDEGKELTTRWQSTPSPLLMCVILQLPAITLNATVKQTFATKQSPNIWLPLSMSPLWTGHCMCLI